MARERVMTSEAHVKRYVKKILDKHGWFWWMPAANAFGKAGAPDFQALRSGVFLAIETKFGYNKPSENQKGFLNSIMAEDGFALVVSEKTLETFEQWMEAFDRAIDRVSKKEAESGDDTILMYNCLEQLTAPFAAPKG